MNLREFARGQTCTTRIPGVCNQDPETVVLAHCNLFGIGGMAMKAPDLCGAHVCSACHDALDMRTFPARCFTEVERREYWLAGIMRTLDRVAANFTLKEK